MIAGGDILDYKNLKSGDKVLLKNIEQLNDVFAIQPLMKCYGKIVTINKSLDNTNRVREIKSATYIFKQEVEKIINL